MKYVPLLTLQLVHPYYADGRCRDFVVEPTPETQRLLGGYRCIVRPLADGLRIAVTAADDGAPLVPLPAGLRLVFQLRLRNPEFALVTELPSGGGSAPLLYTHASVSPRTPTALTLAPPAASRQAAPAPTDGPPTQRVFARVEIAYGGAAPNIAAGPDVFQLEFSARQARWSYYVVTDNASATLRIVDQSKAGPLTFEPARQPAPATDRVAADLAARYPGLRVVRLVSTAAVPCRQTARRSLQLFADTTLAIAGLPNPSPQHYALDVEANSVPDVPYLYQVVTLIANPSSPAGG